jgi:hypothetical protein
MLGDFRPRGIIRQPLTKPLGNNRVQQIHGFATIHKK